MRVIVFSGETREQIGECLADLDTAVTGTRLYGEDNDFRVQTPVRRGEGDKYNYQLPTSEEIEERGRLRQKAAAARAQAAADAEDAADFPFFQR